MQDRCSIERKTTASDGGGGETETWEPHLTVRCLARDDASREAEQAEGGGTIVVRDRRILVPVTTDVTEEDRIAAVTDKFGDELYAGPMQITAIAERPTHLDLFVEHKD